MDTTLPTAQKNRKPIIEKKRRARINRSLAKLLDFLVLNGVCPQPSRVHKYDKADILEMTVNFLKTENFTSAIYQSHRQGFNLCFNETVSTLKNLEICDTVISDLTTMLQNKMNEIIEDFSDNKDIYEKAKRFNRINVDKENLPPSKQRDDPKDVWRPW